MYFLFTKFYFIFAKKLFVFTMQFFVFINICLAFTKILLCKYTNLIYVFIKIYFVSTNIYFVNTNIFCVNTKHIIYDNHCIDALCIIAQLFVIEHILTSITTLRNKYISQPDQPVMLTNKYRTQIIVVSVFPLPQFFLAFQVGSKSIKFNTMSHF